MVDRLAVRTAVSSEAQRNVTAFGGSCEILPNGVDVPAFDAAQPWPTDRPALFFVGRHERRKGLGCCTGPSPTWTATRCCGWRGRGPRPRRLRAERVDRVAWLGPVSEHEKIRRFRGATIACFPSIEGESFGVVLLEAVAARTAIVASDLEGYRHVAPPTARRSSSPPTTRTPSAPCSPRSSTTPPAGWRWPTQAELEPTSSRCSDSRSASSNATRSRSAPGRRRRSPRRPPRPRGSAPGPVPPTRGRPSACGSYSAERVTNRGGVPWS